MAIEKSLLDSVITELKARSGTWPTIARESGVPYKTLQKVAYRDVRDPGISIVEKLAKYLRDHPSRAA